MRVADAAIQGVSTGCLVKCTKAEWPDVRSALQDFAGKSIDNGDHVRAQIALEEVRRLDSVYDNDDKEGVVT